MKYSAIVALIASTQAVQLEYVMYDPNQKLYPPIWDVVKRGNRAFADVNVEKAMKANPSSGTWPVAPAPQPPAEVDNTPHYEVQPWELVVKKGNSAFSNIQVEKALKLIPEPIAVNGEVVPLKK